MIRSVTLEGDWRLGWTGGRFWTKGLGSVTCTLLNVDVQHASTGENVNVST